MPHINIENFDTMLKSADYSVLFTYEDTNRCEDCSRHLPSIKAAQALFDEKNAGNSRSVRFIAMNTTNGQKDPIANKLNIYTFPSLKLLKKGENVDYFGEISAY